jgi:superfamily II DNA or RNA helicase
MKEVLADLENNHHCLVISKRKKHLEYLYGAFITSFGDRFSVRILTGDNAIDYNDVRAEIEMEGDNGTLLFSTLADEGTDIPRLDRLFLAYPGRKLRGFEQAIGRVMRPHPKKKDAIVYDFRDVKVPLLNSQFRERAQNIYSKKGYNVES